MALVKSNISSVKILKIKSTNKLRMKALVEWNTFYQVPEMINLTIFFTRIKNDMDKEDKIGWNLIDLYRT